jgi:hypothetical protein
MTTKSVRRRDLSDGSRTLVIEPDFLWVSTLLMHIERLPNLQVLAKKSWFMMDYFEAMFQFANYRFHMAMTYGSVLISAVDPSVPESVLDELAEHIRNYRVVWPTQFLWGLVRYSFLPANVKPKQPSGAL